MSDATRTDYLALARVYHDLGINVLPVGRNKQLVRLMKWEHWQTACQSDTDVGRMPFREALGVAAVSGAVSAPEGACLACIDADKAPGKAVLLNLLGQLSLPPDYLWAVRTPGKGGGWHVWAIVPGLAAALAKKGLDGSAFLKAPFPGADHIELRWEKVYTVLPGSTHPEGGCYTWEHGNGTPPAVPPAEVEAGRVVRLGKWEGETTVPAKDGKTKAAPPLPNEIFEGQGRNNAMTSLAGTNRRKNASPDGILNLLREENKTKCRPPLTDKDLVSIVRSIGKKKAADPLTGNLRPLEQEAAHAEILRAEWLGMYRYAEHLRAWRRWDGQVWEKVPDSVVADAANKVLCREYGTQLAKATGDDAKRLVPLYRDACKYRSVAGGLSFLRGQDGVQTRAEEWDPEPYTVNCTDGLLDMRTRELRPHDPAAMCTRVTAWGLGKDGAPSSGAWEKHLTKCLPSADVRRQVQRDLGRALVDAVLEHSLSIWYGIGRNGKSTTAEALLKGLAGYGMEAAKDLLVQTKNDRHPTEIAELAGARVVFVEETTDGKSLDEAQVKRLTGGGNKRAHFMRQDNFDVPQTFSISLLVNHRPHVTGGDPGIWERLRLVPWTVRIPFSEQRAQDDVVAELDADGAWMLRWLVAGYADWQADHHWIADEVKAATRDYRAEEDALQGFIDRHCIEEPRVTIPRGELYEVWVADHQRQRPLLSKPSKIAFGKMLRDRGITAAVEGHANAKVYRGITLKERPEQESMDCDA